MFWLRYLPVGADRAMSLVEHLEDLRRRVFLAVGGLLLASAVGMLEQDQLLRLLLRRQRRVAPHGLHLLLRLFPNPVDLLLLLVGKAQFAERRALFRLRCRWLGQLLPGSSWCGLRRRARSRRGSLLAAGAL